MTPSSQEKEQSPIPGCFNELHNEIVHWIEHTYNRRRRQRALGRLTPVEYELAFDPDLEADAA